MSCGWRQTGRLAKGPWALAKESYRAFPQISCTERSSSGQDLNDEGATRPIADRYVVPSSSITSYTVAPAPSVVPARQSSHPRLPKCGGNEMRRNCLRGTGLRGGAGYYRAGRRPASVEAPHARGVALRQSSAGSRGSVERRLGDLARATLERQLGLEVGVVAVRKRDRSL